MRREVVLFDRSLRMFRLGPIDAWRHCVKDCLKFWVMAQFMVPAATRNVNVKLWEAVLAAHLAGLDELPAARAANCRDGRGPRTLSPGACRQHLMVAMP